MNKSKYEEAYFSQSARFQSINKDLYGVFTGEYGRLYVIARGIGAEGAELISDLVLLTIKNFFEKLPQKYNSIVALKQAIQMATKEVLSYISDHRWLSNCGASVAILLSNVNGIFLVNAGDCRILLSRKHKITCLSPKITGNWALDTGTHLNTIGLTQVEPEIIDNVKLYKDDIVILATKGVYQRVTRQEISKALTSKTLRESLKTLWEFAQNKKSNEDFTLIALKVLKEQPMPKDKPLKKQFTSKGITKFIFSLLLFILSLILLFYTFEPYLNDLKAIIL